MVKPSPVMTGSMQAEAFWNLDAGSGASEPPHGPSGLRVGDRVSFVRWVALQGSRESEVVVTLISKAYIYCDDLQTGDVHVFNRQHQHVENLGWLELASEQPQAEPLLLHGYSYRCARLRMCWPPRSSTGGRLR